MTPFRHLVLILGSLILLALLPAPAGATASRPAMEKPADLDDGSWAALQKAIHASLGPQAQLLAGGGAANDEFGFSVAVSGDTALVGVRFDDIGTNPNQGSAYVYTRSGTTWAQQVQLLASDGAENDQFGVSVALSGDTAVVGAIFDDVAFSDQGSAYVYTRSGTTWAQQAKLVAANGRMGEGFGAAVAVSGDTAIVALGRSNAPGGSVYVYARSGTTWTQQALLVADDGAVLDNFGLSLALSGDTALVGANGHDVGGNANQGAAYVYRRDGTSWTQQAKLVAADGAANDQFGFAVALSGDTALVGAPFDAEGDSVIQGSAHVYVRSGSIWTPQAKLLAADRAAGDAFGWAVALSGDTALVGAIGSLSSRGRALAFTRNGSTWTQQAQLLAPDGSRFDQFGRALALSGDTALVGVPFDKVGPNDRQGSAHVYARSGTTWTPQAQLLALEGEAGDAFGVSVALSGDTALVGVSFDTVGANFRQGPAYVYTRSGSTWAQQARLLPPDGTGVSAFGFAVALSGDTALVGSPTDDVGSEANQGSAYVYVRSGNVWTFQARLLPSDGGADKLFGYSVALEGDTALIGANRDDVGANANQGSAYVYTRSGTAWTQQARLLDEAGAAGDFMGWSVALSGDTALVAVVVDDVGANFDQGSVLVYTRSGSVWTRQAQLLAPDGAAQDGFGIAVDLDGDTALVGAFQDDVGANANQGSAYVYARSGSAWTLQAKLVSDDGVARDFFGWSVALSGDTALVSTSSDSLAGNLDPSSVYVYRRNGSTWTQRAQLQAADNTSGDNFGQSLALSGSTALVGAPGDDVSPNRDQGSAYVFGGLDSSTVSIDSVAITEGTGGSQDLVFTVTRSSNLDAFTVDYATADGSATAGSDYTGTSGTLSFTAGGALSQTISVPVLGDSLFEPTETFTVSLGNLVATVGFPEIGTGTGTGTILDDDQQPTTTVITSRTPSSTVVGQPYTVNVTVTAQSTSPTGSVTISDGSASCTAQLTTGTAPASSMSCSLTSTTAGTKTLTASYTASTTAFANSSGTASHLVSAAATTISVNGPARSRINQPTAFSFALSVNAPGAGTPTGTVTLSSGSASCTATLPATSCNLTFATLGSRTVTASYASDGNYAASTSSGLPTLVYALADVSVTKTDGEATYQPGDLIVYTVQVRNAGPDAAAQVRVQDIVPTGLSAVTWTCDASGGAVCSPSSGTGNLDVTLASLPVGALWNYTFYGTVTGLPEQIVNTATLTLPADTTVEDPNPGNNSATDISVLENLFANGFEATLVNGPEGSVRLPSAQLAPVLDEVARIVFRLDDKRGEMARVYARLHLGAVEYALATRGSDGRWTLGSWTGYAVEPTLSWNAELTAGSWQLTRVELR